MGVKKNDDIGVLNVKKSVPNLGLHDWFRQLLLGPHLAELLAGQVVKITQINVLKERNMLNHTNF